MKGLELFNLSGKVALVTGSSHGLGMAVATALAQAGATLVINGASSAEKLAEAVKEYAKQGIHAHAYLFDVTNVQPVTEYVS